MKKIYYLLVLVFIISCTTPEVNKVVITGTIENPTSEYIVFSAYEQFKDTAFLDGENSFSIDIPLEKPVRNVNLMHGEEYAPMYLEPGFILTIRLNADEFDESLTYEGEGSDENNYLIGLLLLAEENDWNEMDIYKLEVAEFKTKLEEFNVVQKEYWKESSVGKESSFWEQQAAALLYKRAGILFNYPNYYKYFMKTDSVYLGEDYDSYLKELDINNPEYLEVGEYGMFLNNYLRKETNKIIEERRKVDSILSYSMVNLNNIPEVFSDEKIRNHLLTQNISSQISYSPLEDIQEAIAYYMKNCTDEDKKAKTRELITKWEKLAKGQPAPVITGKDIEGTIISFSDFQGKYIYVDVWATWCGPCKVEIPYLKELELDYHDKNIVFISCSVDDDEEAWEKMVIEEELKGVQILDEGGSDSQIIKDYMIRGIPTFLLIDREGKIITVKAPRPSGKIREMLDGLEGI